MEYSLDNVLGHMTKVAATPIKQNMFQYKP